MFCPHSVYICFIWIWAQSANISLYSIKWPIFINEPEYVILCRTSKMKVYVNFGHWSVKPLCFGNSLHVLSGSKSRAPEVVCSPFKLNNAFPNRGSASSLTGAWWSRKCSKSFTVTIFMSSGSRTNTMGIINWYTPPYLYPFNLLYM